MYCTKCGNEIADNAKFCNKCGSSQVSTDQSTKKMPAVQKEQSSQPEQAVQSTQTQQVVQPAQPAKGAKSNSVLFVILGILIGVIVAAVLVIFFVIKPFDKPETTTTTATKEVQDDSNKSNNNSNNNSSSNTTTKTVTAKTSTGSTLTGTVRVKDGYVIPDSSTKKYTASEISALGLNDAEMCIAWNEPYARAGYHFKNAGLQEYFNSCSWYHDTGFSGTLSDTGGQNTNTIKSVAGSSAWKNLATN